MAEQALSKDIVGKKLDRFDFTIERGKIKEFCLAIGEKNPIYFSVDEAKKAGYEDIPAPLTFPTVIQFWGYPKIWTDMADLGIDLARILHLKEEYTYHKVLYPGDVWAQSEVSDVKTGKMDMVSFRTTIHNSKNEPILSAEMAIVIRPQG
ncbi:FAS1-like dehydratase domain-containing protein [Leptospira sp. GIMC2001]|uniref:FAS1-like dehydratase domain-containing protein n=1 Tax=Leptospira sp. GIMC2001 TaxID=1513297 RepID=UPI00234B5F3B|nr:MaoC family dehydratase N-terminal domain-containing protein [Leptospira sp. GIMC2001]WCL48588.1 MaoC family dehydratase N-terminal domain-containing protein [Leptospira sp. GIMC2001]